MSEAKSTSVQGRTSKWTLSIAGLVGLAAAIFVQGPLAGMTFFVNCLLVLAVLFVIGLSALIASCVCLLPRTDRAARLASSLRRSTLTSFFLACICVAAFFLHIFIAHARIERAKAWLVDREPALEDYKQLHGTYPGVIEDAVDMSSVGWLIRDDGSTTKATSRSSASTSVPDCSPVGVGDPTYAAGSTTTDRKALPFRRSPRRE